MAANDLQVISADGVTRRLRSYDLGGIHFQGVLVWEAPEEVPSLTGASVRHTVDSNTAVALDPPSADTSYGRVRVYESSGTTPNPELRMYYRSDGTAPSVDGANAMGYLLHGELIMVKLAVLSNFQMIAETGAEFEVYVEWVHTPVT